MPRKSQGKRLANRRRNIRMLEVPEDTTVTDLAEKIHLQLSVGDTDASDYAELAINSPKDLQGKVVAALCAVQNDILNNYKHQLRSLSSRLCNNGCWAFLLERLDEAHNYGVAEELGHLVLDYAGAAADPRMLQLVKRYHRHGY